MDTATVPDLTEINTHVSTYVCGTCGDVATATWAKHQAHYENHRAEGES